MRMFDPLSIHISSRCGAPTFQIRAKELMPQSIARMAPQARPPVAASYSHSMVPGGFDVMSYTTRLIPRTSFTIRLEMRFSTS